MRQLFVIAALALGTCLSVPSWSFAQFIIYDSGGFESFTVNPLSGQDNWLTTDFNEVLGNPSAGVIQSTTTFSGNRAMQVIGNNLFDDAGFANQTFWFQDRTGAPINPVAISRPVVRTTWRQLLTGTQGAGLNMPVAGVYFEGFNAGGTQQVITSVLIDNASRVTAMTTSGNFASSAEIPTLFNQWNTFQVDLNFTTQRFAVFVNGTPVLSNIPFRNSGGATNRLVEFGFQVSTQGVGLPPPVENNAYYDDYLVIATAIPEPATYALLGLGLAGAIAGWRHYRREKKQAADWEVQLQGDKIEEN